MEGIQAKLFGHTDPDYKTWVDLRLVVPVVPSVDQQHQPSEYTIRIRFGARALGRTGLSRDKVDAASEVTRCLSQKPDLSTTLEDPGVQLLELMFDSRENHVAREPTEGIKAKIFEHTNPDYKTWVELRLSVPIMPSVDQKD